MGHCRCLGVSGSSVLLPTLDYFVKSSAELNVENLMSAGSDVSSPREREQFNRLTVHSLGIHLCIVQRLLT